ncbi:MAG: hypothetical protein ACP5H2_12095 [Solirubrobacteraceae bacterium]
MTVAFDIFQGVGIAAAIGIRPFLPSLVVGALAAGDVEIQFSHTAGYGFLQSAPFLLVMLVGAVLLVSLSRGIWETRLQSRLSRVSLGLVAAALGGMFTAAALARAGQPVWVGWIGGVLCAAIGLAASTPFLARLRARLDNEAAAVGVPVIAEGSALLAAALSVLAPPVGVIVVLALLWLIYRGRGRDDQKYAGLHILG